MQIFPISDKSTQLVILTGAGASADSGIETFRGAGGLWEGHDVMEVASPEGWEKDRELVLKFYKERHDSLHSVQPNKGHNIIAALSRDYDNFFLITQNIDDLHEKAGTCSEKLLHMHGELKKMICSEDPNHPKIKTDKHYDITLKCRVCQGQMRPDVVWFGEIPYHMELCLNKLSSAQVFLAIGTSGLVYPAAGFSQLARGSGAYCLEINPEPTGGPFFNEVLAMTSSEGLGKLFPEYC
ncbi:NAD-dependent deacetylase [Candidatus Riflebacteria bacterium]